MVPRNIFALLLMFWAIDAHAVCIDPKTGKSGYRVPLRQEFTQAAIIGDAIVVGVESIADSDDPNGIEKYVLSVRMENTEKGTSNGLIKIVEENASGRYGLEVGKSYFVFLKGGPSGYWIDACGNTETIERSEYVRSWLKATRNKPNPGA